MRTFLRFRNVLFLLFLFATPAALSAQVAVAIHIGPPALPVYEQPPCPVEGNIWTPGYWGYGPAGYYWVPGVWVAPPRVGVLWTPGYWGFGGGIYAWHAGYWGPHVGFYGGINYGYGYGGVGFWGGRWAGGRFAYNTAVTNVNTTVVRNVYVNRTVINNTTVVNHASFNGEGSIAARDQRPKNKAFCDANNISSQPPISSPTSRLPEQTEIGTTCFGEPGAAWWARRRWIPSMAAAITSRDASQTEYLPGSSRRAKPRTWRTGKLA